MIEEILKYCFPLGFLTIFGFFIKFVYDKIKDGILTFEIKAKTFAQLEKENKSLKDENRELTIKAEITMESWQEMAKRELCDECEKEKKNDD